MRHESCEMYSLKQRQSETQTSLRSFELPNIDRRTIRRKKINKEAIFDLILKLREGDFDRDIVQCVRD